MGAQELFDRWTAGQRHDRRAALPTTPALLKGLISHLNPPAQSTEEPPCSSQDMSADPSASRECRP